MTDEKWQEILGKIKDEFEVVNHRNEQLSEDAGPGTVEVIEFTSPLGRVKLERTTQPLIIDKKTIGSRRIGSQTTVEYVYSDTEQIHRFKAYRYNDTADEWQELSQESGSMFF